MITQRFSEILIRQRYNEFTNINMYTLYLYIELINISLCEIKKINFFSFVKKKMSIYFFNYLVTYISK